MHNIENLYFFIFVFTILVILKNSIRIIGSLLLSDSKPVPYSDKELIFLGVSISYFITYINYL